MTIKEYAKNRLKCYRFWLSAAMLVWVWWLAFDFPPGAWGNYDRIVAMAGTTLFFGYFLLRPHSSKSRRDDGLE
ncbi:MAG: hypothetical protein ACR2PI_16685 [Hyphomicrobiaceae bacterium]